MGLEVRKGVRYSPLSLSAYSFEKGSSWSMEFTFSMPGQSQQASVLLLFLPPLELELHSNVYCRFRCTLDVQFVCGCWDLNSVEQEVVTSGPLSLHRLFCTHLNQVFVADCYESLVWRFTE